MKLMRASAAIALPALGLAALAADAGATRREWKPAEANLVDDYIGLCMKGEGRFTADRLKPVGFRDLPIMLQRQYDQVPSARYFRLAEPGNELAYAILYDRPQANGRQYKKVCAVAVKGDIAKWAYSRINAALGMRFASDALRGETLVYGYTDPRFEYELTVKLLFSGYEMTLMQTSHFNDADRASRMARYEESRRRQASAGAPVQ